MSMFYSTYALAESCDFSKSLKTLALNIYHEARNENLLGMQLVGEVTLNRVYSNHYPNNICDVVYQNKQFSWVKNKNDHDPKEINEWKIAVKMAYDLLTGKTDYIDNGATHYYNPDLVKRPRWALNKYKIGVVGNHVFYSIKP